MLSYTVSGQRKYVSKNQEKKTANQNPGFLAYLLVIEIVSLRSCSINDYECEKSSKKWRFILFCRATVHYRRKAAIENTNFVSVKILL